MIAARAWTTVNPLTITKLILLVRMGIGVLVMTIGFWLSRGSGALIGVPIAFYGAAKAINEFSRFVRARELGRVMGPMVRDLRRNERRPASLGESIAMLLFGIAELDGPASAAERVAVIRTIVENFPEPALIASLERWQFERLDEAGRLAILQQLRRGLDEADRSRVFRWCARVTLSDERFNAGEHAVLQVIARELGLRPELARHLFHDVKGRILAERAGRGGADGSSGSGRSTTSMARRSEALSTLGLGPHANDDEVRRRHRELVKLHHPDAHAHLGATEVAAATQRFREIQRAYEVLTSGS